ncbi:MAG: hypothetical protein WC495_06725 [Patescibacteria group bacterium]|jgi:hypothetical protein
MDNQQGQPTAVQNPVVQNQSSDLPPVVRLFSDAWNLFRKKMRSVFRLAVYAFLLQFALSIVALLVGFAGLTGAMTSTSGDATIGGSIAGVSGILLVALLVVYVLLYAWIQGAFILLFSKEEAEPNIRMVITEAKQFIWPLWWASILVVFVVMVGMFLLVIPGIIFAIWFSFTTMIVVLEGLRGTDAMRKSKSYVQGRWWGVFGRLILLSIAIGIASSIVDKIFGSFGSYSGALFSSLATAFIFTPFAIAYQYLFYRSISHPK